MKKELQKFTDKKLVVDIKEINVIPHDNILVVEGIHTSVNQVTGQPTQILLKVAIDRKKANAYKRNLPIVINRENFEE